MKKLIWLVLLLGGSVFGQINNGGGSGGGGGSFSTVTTGANNAALTETTSGSLVPAQTAATTGLGQITGLTNWLTIAPTAVFPLEPTLTSSNTGGSLVQGVYYFRVTYVGLSVTVPSGEVRGQLNATNCASNSTCQITVTMPTACTAGNLPTGVTGCTVWDVKNVVNGELQQAASNACVNITTTTCVVNVVAAGSALSFPASTGVNPPSLQAQSISDQIVPSGFMTKDNGLSYPEYGIDVSALNIITDQFLGATAPAWAGGANGTFTWTDRFFVSDKGAANTQPISNALVSINHESGNTTGTLTNPGSGIDDRALTLRIDNDTTAKPNYEQYEAEYAETFIDNNAFTCAPLGVENCAVGVRGVVGDFRTSGTLAVTTDIAGVAGSFFREISSPATPYAGTPCCIGVIGTSNNLSGSTNLGGAFFVGVAGQAADVGTSTSGNGVAFYAYPPTALGGARFSGSNQAFYSPTTWSNASDLQLRMDGTSPNRLRGETEIYTGIESLVGALPVINSITANGLTTTQLSNSVLANQSVSTGGTAGASSNTYKLLYRDGAGGTVPQTGAGLTINTANANLTATNFDTITFNNVTNSTSLCLSGISSIDIYRTANASQCNGVGCTTGKIGNFPISDCQANFTTQTFNDTGIQGDGTTFPTTPNQTGAIQAFEYNTNTNCAVNSVSPAACGSAAAGAFVVPTTTMTYTVNTSAVTAASRILLTPMSFAGNLPSSPTCVVPVNTTIPTISAISAGTSFTIALGSTTGQTCFQYMIVN